MTTIGHVAARAGVSRATVSRVMNGTATVACSTRERVVAAVESLQYRPSARARDLSLGRNTAVAIVGQQADWKLAPLIVRSLSEQGLDVSMVSARDGFIGVVRDVVARAGGLIIEGSSPPFPVPATPVVMVGAGDVRYSRVTLDHRPALSEAAHELAGAGHATAALLDDGVLSNSNVAAMRIVFKQAGVRLIRPARQSAESVFGGRRPLRAVVAATPVIALRAYNGARALGLDIPHEVAIVAIGKEPVTSEMGFTSVVEPLALTAHQAVALLQHAMTSSRPREPGVHITVRAHFECGLTTLRAA